ncbi:MAG: hypothetical protein WC299_11885 [Kiritimatiellia bacterium]
MSDHCDMTRAALRVLPGWQRKLIANKQEDLAVLYCKYPDLAAYEALLPRSSAMRAALPWQYMEKGRQYHYWMVEERVKNAHLRQRHEIRHEDNYRFFIRGAVFFFKAIAVDMKKNDLDGALKYAGSLIHANQDPASRIHCLEGRHGLHWLALDSLLGRGGEMDPVHSASRILVQIKRIEGIDIAGYRPALLGLTPAEAAFHLHRRHAEVTLASRARTPGMVALARAGRWKKAAALLAETEKEGAKISADILFTALSMARRRFSEQDRRTLARVDLALFPPVDAPSLLSAPYGFSPVARGYALSDRGRKMPLLLRRPTGGLKQPLRSGLATGAHIFGYRIAWILPAGVYRSFRVFCGLHPDLSLAGSAAVLNLKFRGKTFARGRFAAGEPGMEARCSVWSGGMLELALENSLKTGIAGRPQIVWGNLALAK